MRRSHHKPRGCWAGFRNTVGNGNKSSMGAHFACQVNSIVLLLIGPRLNGAWGVSYFKSKISAHPDLLTALADHAGLRGVPLRNVYSGADIHSWGKSCLDGYPGILF